MKNIDLSTDKLDRRYLTMFKQSEDILTAKEAAKLLKISEAGCHLKCRTGELKCIRFQKKIRIPKVWLIEYVISVGEKLALSVSERHKADILDFCWKPRSRRELQRHLGMADKGHFMRTILRPLIDEGKVVLTIPETPNHVKQKYVARKIEA